MKISEVKLGQRVRIIFEDGYGPVTGRVAETDSPLNNEPEEWNIVLGSSAELPDGFEAFELRDGVKDIVLLEDVKNG
jgi:hypothetical protein